MRTTKSVAAGHSDVPGMFSDRQRRLGVDGDADGNATKLSAMALVPPRPRLLNFYWHRLVLKRA
jgi:hypothetical protein